MKEITIEKRNYPLKMQADVLVAGGGVAGVMAACAAAKAGARTILAEQSFSLGGIVTDGPLEAFMTFHDNERRVIAGLAKEYIDRIVALGGSPGCVGDSTGYCNTIVPYDVEIARLAMYDMLDQYGVDVLLQSPLIHVLADTDRMDCVIVGDANGGYAVRAAAYIDATGDATLAYLAGAECMIHNDHGGVQPMSTLIRVGGVDTDSLHQYIRSHGDEFLIPSMENLDTEWLHLWGFSGALQKGYEEGFLRLKRAQMHAMQTPNKGEWILNFTRFDGDVLDNVSKSRGQVETLRQARELIVFLRREIPAFAEAYIVHTGRIGIREGRCVVGKYMLTGEDVLSAKVFPDPVAMGAFPIDIHQPGGDSMVFKKVVQAYQIPLRCLTARDMENVFMAGRCISADHEALASARITATCMATGQAAGVMAALQVRESTVAYEKIRSVLVNQNVILK